MNNATWIGIAVAGLGMATLATAIILWSEPNQSQRRGKKGDADESLRVGQSISADQLRSLQRRVSQLESARANSIDHSGAAETEPLDITSTSASTQTPEGDDVEVLRDPVTTFDALLFSEPRDPSWASAQEQQIEALLRPMITTRATSVACASTVCRVEVLHNDAENDRTGFVRAMVTTPPLNTNCFFTPQKMKRAPGFIAHALGTGSLVGTEPACKRADHCPAALSRFTASNGVRRRQWKSAHRWRGTRRESVACALSFQEGADMNGEFLRLCFHS